jgi:predicted AlkP superfamily phosphohydrolase/phosphomutase
MSSLKSDATVLVGWDGATFSVLDPLMRNGAMPFLRRFSAEGTHGVLQSTFPPVTPSAWTTLMTGVSPGRHGVFDFVKTDRRADRYSYVLGTSGDVSAETVWSVADRNGCGVTCLNFISMFPPPKIRGSVVAGFVPWRYLSRAVHPPELYARIRALPGFEARELALDWDLERKALQGLASEEYESWIRFHTVRERRWFDILSMLMREDPCELTAIVFDGVDKLQHLCYHLLDPQLASRYSGPWADRMRSLCIDYFRQLDGFLEAICNLAGPEARIFIASDHGFRAAGDDIFYVNVWLEQNGYLKWADGVPRDQERRLTLDGHTGADTMFDWSGTTACALTASSNAIFIRKAQYPGAPGVAAGEYEHFRERLRESLLAFKDSSGNPVIDAVVVREEAFPGRHMQQAPDLSLVLHDRSFLSVLRADAPLKSRRAPYGTHHPDGVFFARGPGIRSGVSTSPFSIVNVAPTLLYSLGLPVPKEMEGAPELSLFESSFVSSRPVREETAGQSGPTPGVETGFARNRDEEEALVAQLKALGYLE